MPVAAIVTKFQNFFERGLLFTQTKIYMERKRWAVFVTGIVLFVMLCFMREKVSECGVAFIGNGEYGSESAEVHRRVLNRRD